LQPLKPASDVQHVAVSEEVAGEVEADRQRMFLGRLLEPNHGPLDLSFVSLAAP